MPDYIKRSPEIHEWLKAQGITVEPDGNAPKVYSSSFTGELYVDYRRRNTGGEPDKYEGCFYGPGGEGNMLKALQGWVDTLSDYSLRRDPDQWINYPKRWWIEECASRHRSARRVYIGEGKTDGIALAELLWKIKEGSK